MKNFIAAVRNHRVFGWIIMPCIVSEDSSHDFFYVMNTVTKDNVDKNPEKYSDFQQRIVKISEKYSETQIRKTFGDRKVSDNQQFFKQLDRDFFELNIRPSIERNIVEIIKICRENNVRMFFLETNQKAVFLEDEISLTKENAEAVFNFFRTDEETKYFLSACYKNQNLSFYGKSVHLLSDNPCFLTIDNKLYGFDDVNAKKIIPFVTKKYIPVIKRTEQQYYEKFIKNVIASGAKIHHSGFKIYDEKVLPQAVLSLEKDLTGMTVFQLYFRYNEINFKINSPNKIVVKFFTDDKGGFYFSRLKRDLQFEADIETAVDEIFPDKISEGIYTLKTQTPDSVIQNAFAVNALNENRERLLQHGIIVEQSERVKNYYTGKISLESKIKSSQDWFDVYITVQLENFAFPFTSLKYHILNNIREFQLPNGEVVVLPEEWFEKYKAVFLTGVVNKEDSSVRLKNFQFQLLSGLSLEESVNKRLSEIYDDLTDLTKLPSDKPQNVNAILRPYQITAFNWLKMMQKHGFGACLADDMGLGKTLCTLSLLSESKMNSGEGFKDGLFDFSEKIPSLLFAPKSLIYNWKNEAKKFVPDMKILEFTGQNRQEMIKAFPLYDLIIAGYGTLRNDVELLSKKRFNYIILDESQIIKNPSSKTYQSLMQLSCCHRLTLTGTPVENSLTDLWSQINFLNQGLLGSLESFKRHYVFPIEKNGDAERSEKLLSQIKPFILRRTKEQVLSDLPELVEQIVYCEMSEKQKELYEKEKSKVRNSILDIMETDSFEKSSVMVLQALTQLRQLACSPLLTMDEGYEETSGKTSQIMSYVQNVVSQGHKVLIFSSFVKHLNLVAENLKASDIDFVLLTGGTQNRENVVKKFNENDVPVFLISMKAGGTGLNLTKADYVFIIDPWWNPAVEAQAVARAHRMGQKNSVMVYRFISKDTIEEKIQLYQQKKSDLAETFILKNEILNLL
ncbi:MAG: DEAD/DEAH box helicase [Bacteroidales bacterium]|nr:DEAD/DEAH box helicase [Bacteroidales bacterium]